ncbi:EfeM/EfeO family lipoprotein [Streptomyces thermodiastaticus]|uniref:EfeM/EfeO family lipoprotein n=1 Tax=Streptomyces thermodiastaticus TaxID=44061 RepID=UPI001672AEAF|nr:EfeM/EfeO family lipoprotein [Streptomyces thermodiastaticus]MCE7551470.1 EfeM/EfeO family lipoprotein [Streptomyces thermodiastaticus]GHF85987.1 iron transporter [Streptomyces thermodiastaticus]
MQSTGRGLRSPRGRAVLALAVVLVLAGALAVGLAHDRTARTPGTADVGADGLPHTTVEVSPGRCGRGWDAPEPGLQVFDLHNTFHRAAEVFLEDAASGAVYGEVEDIGPGTTRPLTVRLGKGTYRFRCLPEDVDAATGPTVRIDRGQGGPAASPVTAHDLIPPALDYQTWVAGGLDEAVKLAVRLQQAVVRGDAAAARAAWLPAHLQYERLGGAYDAFGDADGVINGTDAGLPGGVHDPDFTGFHRIEYGLWHGESTHSLKAPAAALVTALTTLRDDWSQARMDPAQLGLRAHEILENTVQFELTGRTDYGSGTSLATARADLDGTRAVLARLRPLLTTRYADLADLQRQLDHAQHLVDGFRHGDRWTPLGRLTRAQREKTDAVFGDLVERLASVATLCDPRRTA